MDHLAAEVTHLAHGGHGAIVRRLGQDFGDEGLVVLQEFECHHEVFLDESPPLPRGAGVASTLRWSQAVSLRRLAGGRQP